ncbi:VHS domain-containing protein [Tirmania nivea]|nr:VHS domain-containing protein [Tirmania nivea]
MFGSSKKPYTAVTVQVDRLTSENYEENDFSGIPDLIESIRLQDSGPSEASRAIRKKLKYGNVHRQLRALTILDALIANAGNSFQRNFADEPLLERLRIAATDSMSDHEVRAKCKILFAQWALNHKNTQGLQSIASLYQQLPQRRRPQPKPRDPSPDENDSPASPTTRGHHSTHSGSSRNNNGNSYSGNNNPWRMGGFGVTTTIEATGPASTSRYTKSKKHQKSAPFNLEKEKPQLIQSLASVSIATTNLTNSLKLINRENERPSENAEVMKRFEACKDLRRTVLRYIQLVESEQFLGSLIHANEELVEALSLFMKLDKPIEEDSDSEDEWNGPIDGSVVEGMGGMSLGGEGKVQRARYGWDGGDGQRAEEEEEERAEEDDPDNPFGDANEVEDFDKEGVTW